MKNQLVMEDVKPKYSLSEELINSISHGLGAVFGVVSMVLCLIKSTTLLNLSCSIVFGVSIIIMYLTSALYHSFKSGKAKEIFRIIDHCTIFILIAGTYTPYTLITLGGLSIGKIIFAIVWGLGLLGIVLNAISLKKFASFSVVCYVIIGWVIVIALNTLIERLGFHGFILLLSGGIFYTVGSIIYALGKKKKYFHSIFHFLCVIATFLQFLSIYFFVL